MSDTPSVVQAWSQVMAAVQAVGKTGHNKQQDYNFRGVDAVVNAAGPALREHGVIVMPTLLDAQYRDVEVGRNRTTMREVTVRVRYSIIGPAGDVFDAPGVPDFGCVPGESMDSGDKGTAKAMSVAYRTFLIQALSLPTGEPDPDATSVERSAREATIPAAPKAKVDQIMDALGVMDEQAIERLKAWVDSEGLPPHPRQLTEPQADKVLAYLVELPGPDAVTQSFDEAIKGGQKP